MASFHEITVPHKDIYEGRLTLETYAAKLWDVFNNEGPEEYRDSKIFFQRTYPTKNLEKILDSVRSRLDGGDVDHFRPIKTPFGGGKTHTLIYLYHKFLEWYGKKPVVLAGTEMDPTAQTLWGEIERQLTGKVDRLSGNVAHGATAIKEVLQDHQPALILIDELLHYINRADGVRVEKTTLGEQTIAFVQELGEAITNLDNVCVVVTLPSSANEQASDQRAAELFEKLKKFSGRIEDPISPVDDHDIPSIIRARLFQSTSEQIQDRAEPIIEDFVSYCEEEGIFPEGMEKSEYRKQFERSYPFLPQVIDVLYKRWGTLQSFQRTRGVLRLLSIVVNDLLKTDKPFISLGDFDLSNERLKGELIRHLDDQFHSVIAQDIAGDDSGAGKVDRMMPQNLWAKELGTRSARAIFMYSHSGAVASGGATDKEVMRAVVSRGVDSANIHTVLEKFRSQLFYLNIEDGKYIFTKEANILKMKLDRMDNIGSHKIEEAEKDLIKGNTTNNRFKVILWPKTSKDVENSHSIKLIILREHDVKLAESIYANVGEQTRVYKNNLFFLTPSEVEKDKFQNSLKSKIAWEQIKHSNTPLKEEQERTLNQELARESDRLKDYVKEYYSTLYIPEKDSLNRNHLSVPISTTQTIDQIVFDYMTKEELINEELSTTLIKSQYLGENESVDTDQIYETMLRTPGERRPVSKQVLENAIKDGVLKGEFGLGEIENGNLVCKYFGSDQHPVVSFDPGEKIMQARLCRPEPEDTEKPKPEPIIQDPGGSDGGSQPDPSDPQPRITRLSYEFSVPEGAVNHTGAMFLNIAEKFRRFRLAVKAEDGEMTRQDVENLKEALRQMGADSDLFDQFNEPE